MHRRTPPPTVLVGGDEQDARYAAANANQGMIPDAAYTDDARSTVDSLCSRCGQLTGSVSVDAADIIATHVVQATRFCSYACAKDFYERALRATGRGHLISIFNQRICKVFQQQEDRSVQLVYHRSAEQSPEVLPLCQQRIPDLDGTNIPGFSGDDSHMTFGAWQYGLGSMMGRDIQESYASTRSAAAAAALSDEMTQ